VCLRRDRRIAGRGNTLDALRRQSNGKGAALAAFARDLVSRSATSRCMLLACVCISCRNRARCRSSTSTSCSVSMNPLITVSGVLSSCDTLAMKSRRMRETASSSVTSRDISSFCSAANGTSCNASVRPVSRFEATMMEAA
jgi:hypothetical protein